MSHKMKPTKFASFASFFLVLSLVLFLGSCEMLGLVGGTSIEERVDAFNDDLSGGNYSRLYTHFHPDTVDRESMENDPSGFWSKTAVASDYAPNTITDYSFSGDTVSGTISNDNGSLGFTMDMQKDGSDYYIRVLAISGSPEIRKID